MQICRPSLRERLIGMGLLRPQDHAETASAREKCLRLPPTSTPENQPPPFGH